MIVIDASAVVAGLVDSGPDGEWAEPLITVPFAAPHLMLVEASNLLRRAVLAGEITDDVATLAHADLLDLPVEVFPFPPFALRVWELRSTVTSYDGWYVALAEGLGAPMATLDHRLTRAPGPRCDFRTPPAAERRR